MGIDLEALANELRDQGENYVEVKDGRLTLYGGCAEDENDDLLCGSEWLIVDDTGDVWTGDDWPDEVMPVYPYLALIARHLGAGQPVAADRAALVGETLYRKCPHCPGDGTSCWTCDDEGYVTGATPEPLSAGEIEAMARYMLARLVSSVLLPPASLDDRLASVAGDIRAVLAALPARYAVPVV